MFPVFSLVLDHDIAEPLSTLYPELYKELTPGTSLSYKTFFVWVAISIYQGCIIQGLSQLTIHGDWSSPEAANGDAEGQTPFKQMLAVSYTALVFNELLMVAAEVTTWHYGMVLCILGTAGAYLGSLPLLGAYFDLPFLLTGAFWGRVVLVLGTAVGPVVLGKGVGRWWWPASYRKVQGV